MAHIVAADFNPPMNNARFSLNSVGMAHIIPVYMCRSYGTQRKLLELEPWIEIHGYNMSHPYGILSV